MGKLRQWFQKWFDNQLEKAFQRNVDKQNRKLYDKYKVVYKDGDNT
jgi:hypothetical protein